MQFLIELVFEILAQIFGEAILGRTGKIALLIGLVVFVVLLTVAILLFVR